MLVCPHCEADYEPCQDGAVRDKCARCYQWTRRHPGRPIPPRGAKRSPIAGPLRVSFAMTAELRERLKECAGANVSAYIREAVEQRLARDTAARARAAGFTAEED